MARWGSEPRQREGPARRAGVSEGAPAARARKDPSDPRKQVLSRLGRHPRLSLPWARLRFRWGTGRPTFRPLG